MATRKISGEQLRKELLVGVNTIADAAVTTLGPSGRTVVISNGQGYMRVTKDGITVCDSVEPDDYVEYTAAQIIRQASIKTANEAGDGTTTTVVLARAIVVEGFKLIAAGANPTELKKGIDKAVEKVVEYIKETAEQVGDDNNKLLNVASISANNNAEIGKLIADAFKEIGKFGTISMAESSTAETYTKIVTGYQFDRGWVSPGLVNDISRMTSELQNPYVLILERKLSAIKDVLKVLEFVIKKSIPLVLIAEDIEGEALATFITNFRQGKFFTLAIKSPEFGDKRKEILNDIAKITGATIISHENGLDFESIDPEKHLGRAGRVTSTQGQTTIVGGLGNPDTLNEYVDTLKSQVEIHPDKEYLKERIAKLSSGVAVLYVGAPTEVEMREKKDRVDDAIRATKAAIEEGIVAGGGQTFIRAIKSLESVPFETEDEKNGIGIIRKALSVPLKQICENCGLSNPMGVVEKVSEGDVGYNAKKGVYEDLVSNGVIDPAKVVRCSIVNAASAASMLLTSDCLLVDIKKEK